MEPTASHIPGVPRRRPLRVALGGISHETNTFSPVPTSLEAFHQRVFLSGDAILRHARGVRNALGGIVDAAHEHGVTLAPALFAAAMPGGPVEPRAWRTLCQALLDRLLAAHRRGPWPLDGAALVLHGAMVVADADDPEGALLRDVRSLLGPEVPIVAVLDFHANVTPGMVDAADLLLAYQTYPHLDTYERGAAALEHLLAIRQGHMHPTSALRSLPLLVPLPAQRTSGDGPFAQVMRQARAAERRPGVVAVSVTGGFPYADVPRAGVAVLVASERDQRQADAVAEELAAGIWARREGMRSRGLDPDAAIARALRYTAGPVVLAEIADNPGAGAPANGTALLRGLLAHRVRGAALAALADADAVAAAHAVGVGASVRVSLGEPPATEPPTLDWRVQALSDGCCDFTNRGPIGTGGRTRLGRAAVLARDGVEVVVCERRVQVLDPALFRAVGIEPSARRILAVKSSVHFRAAFEPLAAAVIEVETPGLSGSDLAALPYRRLRRPIFPLDLVHWDDPSSPLAPHAREVRSLV